MAFEILISQKSSIFCYTGPVKSIPRKLHLCGIGDFRKKILINYRCFKVWIHKHLDIMGRHINIKLQVKTMAGID